MSKNKTDALVEGLANACVRLLSASEISGIRGIFGDEVFVDEDVSTSLITGGFSRVFLRGHTRSIIIQNPQKFCEGMISVFTPLEPDAYMVIDVDSIVSIAYAS